jgi:hypothetical protein
MPPPPARKNPGRSQSFDHVDSPIHSVKGKQKSSVLQGFRLCPSPSILENTREHNVSESGSVSFLR